MDLLHLTTVTIKTLVIHTVQSENQKDNYMLGLWIAYPSQISIKGKRMSYKGDHTETESE